MNPLQDIPLRDIHAAPAVPWWPPAPGWWIVAALLLIGLVYLAIVVRRQWRHRRRRREILAELNSIGATYAANQDSVRLARRLSVYMRRLALLCEGQVVSGLHGKEWLRYLDRSSNTDLFTAGPGQALLDAPYQAKPDYDAGELQRIVRLWAERMIKQVQA